jgi:hypothetical protein
MRFLIWAAPLLAVATPAVAQQGAVDGAAAPVAAAPAKPKKICRKFAVTGRRISETQCYTAAQWAEYDRTQDAAANKLINDVSSMGARSNFPAGSTSTSSLFGLAPQ